MGKVEEWGKKEWRLQFTGFLDANLFQKLYILQANIKVAKSLHIS